MFSVAGRVNKLGGAKLWEDNFVPAVVRLGPGSDVQPSLVRPGEEGYLTCFVKLPSQILG